MKTRKPICLLIFVVLLSTSALLALEGCSWIIDLLTGQRSITEEEAEKILDMQRVGAITYEELVLDGDPAAAQKTVEWFQNQEMVKESGISEDGTIWIRYDFGLEAEILVHTMSSEFRSVHSAGRQINPQSGPPIQAAHLSSQWSSATANKPKSALILLPFYTDYSGPILDGLEGEIEATLKAMGYEVHGPIKDSNVTIEVMGAMRAHEVIYIFTHGHSKSILTGQRVRSVILTTLLPHDWSRIGIGWVKGDLFWRPFFSIKAPFIRDYRYPGSFVLLNSCKTMKDMPNPPLAKAFLDSGASVVLGWTDLAYMTEWCMAQVTREMLRNLAVPKTTVAMAYTTPSVIPYGINTQQKYSIDALYPITVYKDSDGDRYIKICYSTLRTVSPCFGDTELEPEHDVDFVFKGNENFVLTGAVFAESSNNLYAVTPFSTGGDVLIGPIQTSRGARPEITDIAWNDLDRSLYGVSFEALYQIDRTTGLAHRIGTTLDVADVNALAFDASGNLYSATDTGDFVFINISTGRASVIGTFGNGYESSGDLAFGPDGSLFGTVKVPGRTTDVLISVNPSTGKATEIGETGYRDVFGLFFVEDQLYGVTAENLLITIDTQTGNASLVRQLSFSAWGAQSEER